MVESRTRLKVERWLSIAAAELVRGKASTKRRLGR